jgi:hypothetical protein
METDQDDLPAEEEMESDEESLGVKLPFLDYMKDSEKLRGLVKKLEDEYNEREKVIDRIMKYGTGIESEKALRMYPTPVLKKWEATLESFRATDKLKHHS